VSEEESPNVGRLGFDLGKKLQGKAIFMRGGDEKKAYGEGNSRERRFLKRLNNLKGAGK